MPDERLVPLPRECCGFLDENEAFAVQFVDNGRLICLCYGKEAYSVYWIVIDSFYGTKKIVIADVNKIDDDMLLLSLDSYVLRTFHAASPHTVAHYRLEEGGRGHTSTGILTAEDGVVQRIRRQGEWLIVVVRVHEEIIDEVRKSTEFRVYRVGEWEQPKRTWRVVDSTYSHLDFPHVNDALDCLHFFHGLGRAFKVEDFRRVAELSTQPTIRVEDKQTLGMDEIFGTNAEHLAKNESGVWYNSSFHSTFALEPLIAV